ncbi:unnamed protein product [Prorocentrum cordatum]|uniref:SET domain-containing protein n=1 Tax=Prorocentrum cordatum TaxID=2364126 RepID=A0ABN9T7Y3_9DINO|nr:unnamed protein product [Polarella glacialis]
MSEPMVIFSYSAGISACGKGTQWQRALALLSEMREAKLEASAALLEADGPVWTREYPEGPDARVCAMAEDVLRRVGAFRMVVGHTIQEGPSGFRVRTRCSGRVVLADTAISRAYGGEPSYVEHDGEGGAVAVYPGLGLREPLPPLPAVAVPGAPGASALAMLQLQAGAPPAFRAAMEGLWTKDGDIVLEYQEKDELAPLGGESGPGAFVVYPRNFNITANHAANHVLLARLQAGLRLLGLALGVRLGVKSSRVGSGAAPWGKGLLPAVPRGGAAAAAGGGRRVARAMCDREGRRARLVQILWLTFAIAAAAVAPRPSVPPATLLPTSKTGLAAPTSHPTSEAAVVFAQSEEDDVVEVAEFIRGVGISQPLPARVAGFALFSGVRAAERLGGAMAHELRAIHSAGVGPRERSNIGGQWIRVKVLCFAQRLARRQTGALVFSDRQVSPSVRVAQVAPLGRELVASAAVDAGEVLIRLPPELCIPAPGGEGAAEEVPEDVRLAASLLEVAESDYWSAYRAIWPTREDLEERMPVFWGQARFEGLRPRLPGLEAQVRSRRKLLREAASLLGAPLDRLTWAHALVSARAVGADACAMIPGVDMANHDVAPNAELVVAGLPGVATGRATVTKLGEVWPQGTASIVAMGDIAVDEPIRISYGRYPNQLARPRVGRRTTYSSTISATCSSGRAFFQTDSSGCSCQDRCVQMHSSADDLDRLWTNSLSDEFVLG